MAHKVSIVVPVYGVEQYIEECILSLVGQTYENLEIILVDDGGKDKSGEICDRYAVLDNRVRVIHKANGGAASARNAGLDAATGAYICMVDGDDVVSPDYVQHLLTQVETHHADIGVCGLCNWTKAGKMPVPLEGNGVYTSSEYLLRFLKDWSCSLQTNKIFRREVIGDIRLPEGHKIDDEFFTYLVVMNSRKVVVMDEPLYIYRMRGSSVMQDMGPHQERIMLDRIEYVTTRYGNVAERVPEIEPDFFQDALDTITRYWHHSKSMPKAQKQIRSWVKAYRRRILKMDLSLRLKLGYLYQLYCKKPAVTAEQNPIKIDPGVLFE